MGRSSRLKPTHLPDKLRQIRLSLGLSQAELVRQLGLTGHISRAKVSEFERGEREPTLAVLLKYAQAAGVWIDVLADDELELPAALPSSQRNEGLLRKLKKSSRKR